MARRGKTQKKKKDFTSFLHDFGRSSRSAPHPGSFLDTNFLQPLKLSQTTLAAELGVSRRRINELIVGKRAITPDTAIKLAEFFNTDPEFWLMLQLRWDLKKALENQKASTQKDLQKA